MKTELGADNMNDQPSRSSKMSPERHTQACCPPCGTRYAPVEILSSPESGTKRRKTANTPQVARQKPHKVSRQTESVNYNGISGQELTKTLAEPTDIKASKKRYYAVAIGATPGVYTDWPSAAEQVHGFRGAKHKKFKSEEDALSYVAEIRKSIGVAPWTFPDTDKRSKSMMLEHEPYSRSVPALQPTAQMSFDSGYNSNGTDYTLTPFGPSSPPAAVGGIGQDCIPLNDGPKLVPEQQHVVDLIVQGYNVFYTGSAGCGKSTILKAFVKQLQQRGKRVKIVAPTNLAALNVGGQTTWNFAGWTPDSMKIRIEKLMENSRGKESWKKFDETDVLVIDEISMIENLQFERLNMIMKASRGAKYGEGAFGGVQLVVTGDVSYHRCR